MRLYLTAEGQILFVLNIATDVNKSCSIVTVVGQKDSIITFKCKGHTFKK